MKISIVGVGYVGLVTGVVFASFGNDVICVDNNSDKISKLRDGIIPIYEPGLEEFIAEKIEPGKLQYTTNLSEAVASSDLVFIAVGTPSLSNGSTDLSMVANVAQEIAKSLTHYTIIVDKSTVPIGVGSYVQNIVEQNRTSDIPFDVVSNPEFLREGTALDDLLHPDRVVIGSSSEKAAKIMEELYVPIDAKIVRTDVGSAELIKYASNAFLAMKITFANSMANLCDEVGANVEDVTQGIGLDRRIGPSFLSAGIGYGGSCFPKDVRSLVYTADQYGCDFKVLKATLETNENQPRRFVAKMKSVMGSLKGKRIAALGLAFKKDTDDIRESKSIQVIKLLKREGARVLAYDPVAADNTRRILPDLEYVKSAREAINGSDAIALLTEWDEFKEIDFADAASIMRGDMVFDGRNLYNEKQLKQFGLSHYGVGKGKTSKINTAALIDELVSAPVG
jgi:UDPglucose 6-dehydrogenase